MPVSGAKREIRVAVETGEEESMDKELDELLNGSNEEAQVEAPSAPTPEEPPAAEVGGEEQAQARTYNRDGHGKFAAKGETQEEAAPAAEAEEDAPPASEEESGPIPVAALKKERARRQTAEQQRQAAEARALAAEEQLRQLQMQPVQPPPQQAQQPPQAAATPPDRWEDPDGYDRWLVAKAAETAREETMRAIEFQRIAGSAQQFASQTPDYAEKVGVFEQMVNANPALLDQMHRSPNPAKFAYDSAKMHLEIAEHGGIEGVIEARVQEALRGIAPAAATAQVQIPATLADAQSSRGSGAGYQPPSLDDLLK